MPTPTDDDLESEMLDAKLRAARRAQLLMRPCPHCYAVPKIDARDEFGYAKTLGWDHEVDCPDRNPDA
jgi:hypothetical protein